MFLLLVALFLDSVDLFFFFLCIFHVLFVSCFLFLLFLFLWLFVFVFFLFISINYFVFRIEHVQILIFCVIVACSYFFSVLHLNFIIFFEGSIFKNYFMWFCRTFLLFILYIVKCICLINLLCFKSSFLFDFICSLHFYSPCISMFLSFFFYFMDLGYQNVFSKFSLFKFVGDFYLKRSIILFCDFLLLPL